MEAKEAIKCPYCKSERITKAQVQDPNRPFVVAHTCIDCGGFWEE